MAKLGANVTLNVASSSNMDRIWWICLVSTSYSLYKSSDLGRTLVHTFYIYTVNLTNQHDDIEYIFAGNKWPVNEHSRLKKIYTKTKFNRWISCDVKWRCLFWFFLNLITCLAGKKMRALGGDWYEREKI